MVIALAVLVFLCWIVWAGAHGGWTATETSARYIGFGVAAVFAVPLVMLLWALPRFVSSRAVTVDAHGIAISHGRERIAIGWSDLYAVGIGYERRRRCTSARSGASCWSSFRRGQTCRPGSRG